MIWKTRNILYMQIKIVSDNAYVTLTHDIQVTSMTKSHHVQEIQIWFV